MRSAIKAIIRKTVPVNGQSLTVVNSQTSQKSGESLTFVTCVCVCVWGGGGGALITPCLGNKFSSCPLLMGLCLTLGLILSLSEFYRLPL